MNDLQYSHFRSQCSSNSESPAWLKWILLPVLDFLVPSTALSSTMIHSQKLFLAGMFRYLPPLAPKHSEPCPFLSQCYLRYSISVISTVFPCKIGSSHLGINYLLEMPELHQPFEPLCPPCPSLQSSHNHLFPMWLHLWCNLYPTGVCESSLSPSFTENTT